MKRYCRIHLLLIVVIVFNLHFKKGNQQCCIVAGRHIPITKVVKSIIFQTNKGNFAANQTGNGSGLSGLIFFSMVYAISFSLFSWRLYSLSLIRCFAASGFFSARSKLSSHYLPKNASGNGMNQVDNISRMTGLVDIQALITNSHSFVNIYWVGVAFIAYISYPSRCYGGQSSCNQIFFSRFCCSYEGFLSFLS